MKSGLNYNEEIDEMKDAENKQEIVMRRPLATYPSKVNRTTGRLKQSRKHASRPGGFRVRQGFQVGKRYYVIFV